MFDYPCLYILMRSDLASLRNSSGRVAAQASHAANQCVFQIRKQINSLNPLETSYNLLLNKWENNRGFGTCIVLDVGTVENLYSLIRKIDWVSFPMIAGVVHDDTYPLRDGDFVHKIPIDTCGFIFGNKEDCSKFMKDHFNGELPLY